MHHGRTRLLSSVTYAEAAKQLAVDESAIKAMVEMRVLVAAFKGRVTSESVQQMLNA